MNQNIVNEMENFLCLFLIEFFFSPFCNLIKYTH